MVEGDFGAEGFHRFQVEVDGARADRASTGERDFGFAVACDEGAEDEDAGAHGADEVVGGAQFGDA